jgi:hypothetical protein
MTFPYSKRKTRRLSSSLGNFVYATKEEAVHSRGKKKGKLKKGYKYVGNGYIIRKN